MRGIVNQLIDGLLYFSALHATTNVSIAPLFSFRVYNGQVQESYQPQPEQEGAQVRPFYVYGKSFHSPQISSMLWLVSYAGAG